MVERQLPKLYVEGSIPFARSNFLSRKKPATLKRLSFLASFCQIAGGGLPIYMQLEFTTGVVTTGSPLVSGGTVVEVMQSQRDIQRR